MELIFHVNMPINHIYVNQKRFPCATFSHRTANNTQKKVMKIYSHGKNYFNVCAYCRFVEYIFFCALHHKNGNDSHVNFPRNDAKGTHEE